MTPLRQVLNAALVAASIAVALPTSAEPLAPMGPPTAAEVAADEAAAATASPAPVKPAAAPVASAKPQPAWLATRPAPKTSVAGKSALPSTGRIVGLLVVVGSLGAAALYLKRRGKPEGKRATVPQRLTVVSSTRIGPKAHAVVISVAGRQMLLGVTDSSVKRLAFIDEVEDEAAEREPARRPNAQSTARAAAIAVRAVAADPAQTRSFGELLKTAFKKREPEPTDAASILASETQDVVGGKPVVTTSTPSVRMLDVEGQAQGLIRRLGGPRQ
jgi:flagellar biogenesis protein FliO